MVLGIVKRLYSRLLAILKSSASFGCHLSAHTAAEPASSVDQTHVQIAPGSCL